MKSSFIEDCRRSKCAAAEQPSYVHSPSDAKQSEKVFLQNDKPLYGMISCSRVGRTCYRAKLSVGPFTVLTSYSPDATEIQARVKSLVQMRSTFLAALESLARGTGGATLAESEIGIRDGIDNSYRSVQLAFQHAVLLLQQEEVAACNSGRPPWQIRFFATVPAKAWVGKHLSTPTYATTAAELQRGLEAWRMLATARGAVYQGQHYLHSADGNARRELIWTQLRQAYVQIWTDAGRCPQKLNDTLQRQEVKKLHVTQPHVTAGRVEELGTPTQSSPASDPASTAHSEMPGGKPEGDKSATTHTASNHDTQFAAETCIRRLLRHWVVHDHCC